MARRHRRPSRTYSRRRRGPLIGAGVCAAAVLAVLVGVNLWVHARPPSPDAATVHADIHAGRSGAEVTFDAALTGDPTRSGSHERMQVVDRLGDRMELDYNLSLGRPVPVHRGDSIVVHGQLYIDPGRVGVHCLHSHISRGCSEPGWIRFGGATYS